MITMTVTIANTVKNNFEDFEHNPIFFVYGNANPRKWLFEIEKFSQMWFHLRISIQLFCKQTTVIFPLEVTPDLLAPWMVS